MTIRDLLKVIRKLHKIKDYNELLEHTLHEARIMARADAGTLYLCMNNRLYFNFIENETLFPEGKSENKFAYTNNSIPISHSSISGYVAINRKPLIIDDAYNIDPALGIKFNKDFDKKMNYQSRSHMAIPLCSSSNKVMGIIQLINAKSPEGNITTFTETNKIAVSFLAEHAVLALEKADLAREMVMRMVKMAQFKDPSETEGHVNRVAEFSVVLYENYSKKMGVSLSERQQKKDVLRAAAMLHDIGKAAIPGDILARQEEYNEEEKQIMYHHTVIGARLFTRQDILWDKLCYEVVLNHHERWDGSGYPGNMENIFADSITFGMGKTGRNIPLSARIVAICDVFDALTTCRHYKQAWSNETAMTFLKRQSGKHFDPQLIEIFSEMLDTIKTIQASYPDPVKH